METHYIYCIENKINHKKYIGQTNNLKGRWSQHTHLRNDNKNMYVDKAINKYGAEKFDFIIIDKADNQIKADELERKYIKEFNTLKPNGYNLLIGGREQQGSWNKKKILVYTLNGEFKGEYECAKDFWEENNAYDERGIRNCCRGKTKRYKDLIFHYKDDNIDVVPYTKKKSEKRKKVYQFDYDGNLIGEFESVEEAAIKTKTSRTSIVGCCKGYYKTANKFVWSYSNNPIIDSPQYVHLYKIKQIDDEGNVINTFHNCKEAEEKLGFKKKAYKMINKYLNKNKKYNGFYWEREVK